MCMLLDNSATFNISLGHQSFVLHYVCSRSSIRVAGMNLSNKWHNNNKSSLIDTMKGEQVRKS